MNCITSMSCFILLQVYHQVNSQSVRLLRQKISAYAFCKTLHVSHHLFEKYLSNAFVRVVVGSLLIIGLTILIQTDVYSGAGVPLIEDR